MSKEDFKESITAGEETVAEKPSFVDVFGIEVPVLKSKDKWKILSITALTKTPQEKVEAEIRAEELAFGSFKDAVEDAISDHFADDDSIETFAGAIDKAIQLMLSDGKNEEAKNA